MTDLLYLKDCYLREFTARVTHSGSGWAILDRTAFYPQGGGQEPDYGTIEFEGKIFDVKDVQKRKGFDDVIHYLEESFTIPENSTVKGTVDWNRRHKEMRMHTAQHLFSALVLDEHGAETVGNQIHPEQSRVDFAPVKLVQQDYEKIGVRFNEIVDKKIPVQIKFMLRDEVMDTIDKKRLNLFSRIPASVTEIRVIEIEGFDRAPCGGTHVSNTGELGHIRILGLENKGKDKQRVTFELT